MAENCHFRSGGGGGTGRESPEVLGFLKKPLKHEKARRIRSGEPRFKH